MASSATSTKASTLAVPSPFERPKLNTRGTTAHRLPPPALFQGPPSKNASHISLALPTDRVPGAPPAEIDSSGQQHRIIHQSRVPAAASFSGPSSGQLRHNVASAAAPSADDHRAEQLWAEMQKTLADVELSAMNTSHVFGSSHLRSLEDLRTAQLSLAQTWAKTEADELLEHDFDNASREKSNVGAAWENKGPTQTATPGSTRPKTSSPLTPGPGFSPPTAKDAKNDAKTSAFSNNKNLEEETERDIQLARKRREANDRYFSQVNRGVLEVVSKLDEVAGAMRRVERESREIWDESSDDMGPSEDEEGDAEADADGGSATERSGLTDSPEPVRKEG